MFHIPSTFHLDNTVIEECRQMGWPPPSFFFFCQLLNKCPFLLVLMSLFFLCPLPKFCRPWEYRHTYLEVILSLDLIVTKRYIHMGWPPLISSLKFFILCPFLLVVIYILHIIHHTLLGSWGGLFPYILVLQGPQNNLLNLKFIALSISIHM